MDKTEQQMIERFIEIRNQADHARDEAAKLDEAAADLGYLALMQYPNFLDDVSENSKQKGDDDFSNSPFILIQYLLTWRWNSGKVLNRLGMDRKSGETTRQWLERCERAIVQKRETQDAPKKIDATR